MSEPAVARETLERAGSGARRVRRVWRGLTPDRRQAALAALGLFVTLFLPWYQETVIATARGSRLQSSTASLTGWGAFSFVEAAVLLVALGVLLLIFQRAEGRAFHLPGGDGWVITAAGTWTCLLVIWRIFDKQGTTGHGQFATTSGIEWGIFVALADAALLAWTGTRIRAMRAPEPPLPGAAPGPRGAPRSRPPAPRDAAGSRRQPESWGPSSWSADAAGGGDSAPARPRRPERPRGVGDPLDVADPPEMPTVVQPTRPLRDPPLPPRPQPGADPGGFEAPRHGGAASRDGGSPARPASESGGDEQLTIPFDERAGGD